MARIKGKYIRSLVINIGIGGGIIDSACVFIITPGELKAMINLKVSKDITGP